MLCLLRLAGGGAPGVEFGPSDLPVVVRVEPVEHCRGAFGAALGCAFVELRLTACDLLLRHEAVMVEVELLEQAVDVSGHIGASLIRGEEAAACMGRFWTRRGGGRSLSDPGAGEEGGDARGRRYELGHSDNLRNGHYRAREW